MYFTLTYELSSSFYVGISVAFTPQTFPDFPPSFYNFTGDEFSEDIILTVQGTKVKILNYNETVEIVFQGTNVLEGSMNHPMHLHGHSFNVVGSGFGNFDNETDPEGFNLVDPPEVTTFGVPKKGWIAIRFVAKNPGVWFWHCHLERHLSWGMNTVFIVKNGDTAETSIRPPPAYMPSCEVPSLKDWRQNDDGLDDMAI
ncbi:Laccase-14 [Morella rubra]|uniref:Laccase-14 n=1 Tax=Morella rubra TaxID=262757 RepID=A0A6A1W684_9ROSI|nr:Laccase-14 [Morella rubra]